jgi:hypothetical protein
MRLLVRKQPPRQVTVEEASVADGDEVGVEE